MDIRARIEAYKLGATVPVDFKRVEKSPSEKFKTAPSLGAILAYPVDDLLLHWTQDALIETMESTRPLPEKIMDPARIEYIKHLKIFNQWKLASFGNVQLTQITLNISKFKLLDAYLGIFKLTSDEGNVYYFCQGDQPEAVAMFRDATEPVAVNVVGGKFIVVSPLRKDATHFDNLLAERLGKKETRLIEKGVGAYWTFRFNECGVLTSIISNYGARFRRTVESGRMQFIDDVDADEPRIIIICEVYPENSPIVASGIEIDGDGENKIAWKL